jgi:hypothetical protein
MNAVSGWLAPLSALLTMCCVFPYLRDMAMRRTRPHRVTWFVFALLSAIAAINQREAAAMAGAWLAAGSAAGFGVVFLASIRAGTGGRTLPDIICLTIGIAGTLLSIVMQKPMLAVIAVVVAEISAVWVTARKACRDPESETLSTWMIDALAGGVAILAVAEPSPVTLLYPVHHMLMNLWVAAAIIRGRSTHRLASGRTALTRED